MTLAVIDVVRTTKSQPSFRGPSAAREPGIHTPGQRFGPRDLGLWVPGSGLRPAPERRRPPGDAFLLIHISNSPTQTCVIARCKRVPGHPPSRHLPLRLTLPPKGERCADGGVIKTALLARPHPGCQAGCGPPSAHRGGNDLRKHSEIRTFPASSLRFKIVLEKRSPEARMGELCV
jgi:hypothetical protein